MKHCPNCGIDVNTDRITCPLCRNTLDTLDNPKMEVIYQPYPKFKEREKRRRLFFKILVFLSIVACILGIGINYLTFDKDNPSYWCLIVIGSVIVAWFFGRGMFISKGNFGKRLTLLNFSCLLLLLVIEFDFSSKSWVLNYMFPFLVIAELITLSLMSLISGKQFKRLTASLIMLSIISAIPYILVEIEILTISWPAATAVLTGIVVVLGMIVFGFRTTIEQLKKYFHI
jgi:hypothetical protein